MKLLLSIICLVVLSAADKTKPNSCKTMADYNWKLKSDCVFNPNVDSNTMAIVRRAGYPVLSYIVATEDGYLVTLYRIPKKDGQPVFVQHGAESSSELFVSQDNSSIAFQLYLAGYDVWLGNSRGSFNSREHMFLNKDSKEYWNYTLDDMGNYELPALIDFIAEETGKKGDLIYIGHSQGTTTALIYDLLHPEHAKDNLKGMILLGPVAYLTDLPIPFIHILFKLVDNLIDWGYTHFGSRNKVLTNFCLTNGFTLEICTWLINIGYGKSNQYPPDQIPTMFSYAFMEESLKPIKQFTQIGQSHNFQAYDYKKHGNNLMYGTPHPRQYDLGKVNLPTFLFAGLEDHLASVKNVERLKRELPENNPTQLFMVNKNRPDIKFNHLNFFYGKDKYNLVYNDMFKVMENHLK